MYCAISTTNFTPTGLTKPFNTIPTSFKLSHLKNINVNNNKSIDFKRVVTTICLVLLLFLRYIAIDYYSYAKDDTLKSNELARIDEEIITYEEYNEYIIKGVKYYEEVGGRDIWKVKYNNIMMFDKLKQDVLNELILIKIQLQKIKVDVYAFEIDEIVKYLETIGDSIVCYKAGTIVKVHVHTLTPYKALEFCQQFGEFLTIKIENMTLQHSEVVEKKNVKKKGIKKKYGVVTCATGQGLIDTFYGFGVDEVIDGGQCHNPSTKDFIDAFERINADYIYVLPNNSNIIMTANEAKDLYKDATIYVINTKDFGQAYAALSLLDMNLDDPDEIARGLEENMLDVCTGMISKSIRDANINHVDIHEDDYIGFSGKTMITSHKDKMETYFELIDKLDVRNKNFIITFFGKDVTEDEKKAVRERLSEEYKNVEAYDIDGGQDVYDFIIIIE